MHRLGHLWNWLKWPIALAVLAGMFLWHRESLGDFVAHPKHWGWLVAAFCLYGTAVLVSFVRWYLLVRSLGFAFRLADAFRLGFLGMLFNYVGPGIVGGDMFKAVFLARGQPARRATAAATVLLDRILGLISLFQLGAIATLVRVDPAPSELHAIVNWILWSAAILGTLAVVLALQPAVTRLIPVQRLESIPVGGRVLKDVYEGFHLYQHKPAVLFAALAMGIFNHAATFTGLYCCALGLQIWAPDLWTHFYFMPAAVIMGLLPTPGGIGPMEFAIQEAYGAVASGAVSASMARADGLFAATAFRLVNMLVAAIGAVYYLASKREIDTAIETAEPTGKSPIDLAAPRSIAC